MKKIDKNMAGKMPLDKKYLLLLWAGVTLLLSLPVFMKGINCGDDLFFHLMRIEGLADEFRQGHIPPKMSSLWLLGYGYPVSIYYGDILLWFFAYLRIAGLSVIFVYKLYIIFINAATTAIAYGCFKKIFGRRDISVVVSFAYVTAGYRIMNLYSRVAVGEYSAVMFLPVVALAVYRIYTSDKNEWSECRKNALILSLGMSGLIGTHILSTEMVFFTLILICVFLWKKTFKEMVFHTYCLAVIETILLNLYFVIPFLDYYFNVNVNINNSINNLVPQIQYEGAYIGQYFAFFQKMFGIGSPELSQRMSYTPGPVLMLAFMAGVVLWVCHKPPKEMKLFVILSAVMLFMSSNLFPWDALAEHSRVGHMLAQVQFPWRYLSLAILFLAMLLGSILKFLPEIWERERISRLRLLAIGICVFMSFYYVSDYCHENDGMMDECDVYALMVSIGWGDYLRPDADLSKMTGMVSSENMQEVSFVSRKGYTMELYCRTGDTDGFVEVPMLNYKGYQVIDEYGNQYEITDGTNDEIRFLVPAEFAGNVTITFSQPWYWRAGEIVSAIAFLYICVLGAIKVRKSNSYHEKT